jgi:hypothetical protein
MMLLVVRSAAIVWRMNDINQIEAATIAIPLAYVSVSGIATCYSRLHRQVKASNV